MMTEMLVETWVVGAVMIMYIYKYKGSGGLRRHAQWIDFQDVHGHRTGDRYVRCVVPHVIMII